MLKQRWWTRSPSNCADGRRVAWDMVCTSSNPKPPASRDPGSRQEHGAALFSRLDLLSRIHCKGKKCKRETESGLSWNRVYPSVARGIHCHSQLWIY